MKKTKKNEITKIIIEIIIYFLLISFAVIICMQSEINPFSVRTPTADSDVYIFTAKLMHEGKKLYSDIFTGHKGPIYFFIEYIGLAMSSNNYVGIWIIETIFMIATLIFLYKTANLICKNKLVSIIVIFFSIMPFSKYFVNGNYPEEYCLAFTSISLYYMTGYLTGNFDLNRKICVIIGICAGFSLMIKINLISVWLTFYLVILIKTIMKKDWKKLREFLLFFIVGAAIVLITTCIILVAQGNFVDFIKEYIIFNFRYSKVSNSHGRSLKEVFVNNTLYLSLIVCVIDLLIKIIKKQKRKDLTIAAFLFLIVTFIITIIPRNDYYHYGTVFIPTYVIPIAFLFNNFIEILYVKENALRIVLAVIIFIGLGYHFIRNDINRYINNIYAMNNYRFSYKENSTSKYIKENTNKDDKIIVLGNVCHIYLMSDRSTDIKYMYQVPINNVDPSIVDKTIKEIDEKRPKMIVLCNYYEDIKEKLINYISDNNTYSLVYRPDALHDIYLRNE